MTFRQYIVCVAIMVPLAILTPITVVGDLHNYTPARADLLFHGLTGFPMLVAILFAVLPDPYRTRLRVPCIALTALVMLFQGLQIIFMSRHGLPGIASPITTAVFAGVSIVGMSIRLHQTATPEPA